MTDKSIGIGWDVGGWMGNNHGVAICEWDPATNTIDWIGTPTEIAIPENENLSLQYLIDASGDPFKLETINDHRIIIGVDAPLGYPKAFIQLINGKINQVDKPEKEIYNPLAYRYTDRVIYETWGKKPLSAVFDRIGNNATAAMSHAKMWEKHDGFKICPMAKREKTDKKLIIEVYPALVKASKTAVAHANLTQYLPTDIKPGTDAYDACICALYAIAFGADDAPLPSIASPPAHAEEVVKEEGWIYYFEKG
ncbi:DUF429 domain-containing protein [Salicibibacter cibarius]|uniref:DUF429 domain-containing protein n=1 Tax=Salicibibacter cibarius TaxID=2743000 RepID=A0A7T7CBR9_9BACI|nr:DUF429 domain-containing protein [Salicibibacter cibarius]QQK76145.1 DUF429 domain-containing protein [Salicibibacter cibarius]